MTKFLQHSVRIQNKSFLLFCILVFIFSVSVNAQYIDTCTIGSSRTYSVVGGLDNSIFEWKINGAIQEESGIDVYYTWYEAGVFNISVTETTQNGCTGKTYTYLVLVSDEIENYEIQIPNVFTPNNDGQNDFFTVNGRNLNNYEIQIFNRWGEVLYKSTDIETAWDGKHKGAICEAGVYYYSIGFSKNGKQKKENGFLHLFR